jgi:hypothetical protein
MAPQIIARTLFISALIFFTRAACAQDIRIAVAASPVPSRSRAMRSSAGPNWRPKDINRPREASLFVKPPTQAPNSKW